VRKKKKSKKHRVNKQLATAQEVSALAARRSTQGGEFHSKESRTKKGGRREQAEKNQANARKNEFILRRRQNQSSSEGKGLGRGKNQVGERRQGQKTQRHSRVRFHTRRRKDESRQA